MADVAAEDRKSAAASFASDDNLEKVFSDQPLGDPAEAARCEKALDRALSSCATVRTLRQALEGLGVATPGFVRCTPCPEGAGIAGGYVPGRGIVLCQQWAAQWPSEVPNTLTHELIHAYDDARARLDWGNLRHHACTEIRAALLSGDCTFGRELDRGMIGFWRNGVSGAGARCVRRRAELSVAANPACAAAADAAAAVEAAWPTCYKDYAPWDRVP